MKDMKWNIKSSMYERYTYTKVNIMETNASTME